ncbi:hypothetical protein B0H11DRAFT_1970169 [Mycena galericulata]|nr:hypothetical protein B0H11DRAFT_1970169 [Mycena galericulata]
MPSFSIPISVKRRAQRTVKVVGFGFKSVLTTTIPGKLVIRRKVAPVDFEPFGIQPWDVTPPKPPNVPEVPPAVDGGWWVPVAADYPEEIHETLVSAGIKVRDFAYPTTRVGHTTPIHPKPMSFVKNEDAKSANQKEQTVDDIPASPENAPMPCVSSTWTEPHQCLRPLLKRKWDGILEGPSPEKPYRRVYELHRIPSWFDQAGALLEVEYRLSQKPRTLPIHGQITRRLLTLSPHLIDVSRLDEMDLEELRRYDQRIVWQLANGIEPYPWRAVHHPNWTPSPANRELLLKAGIDHMQTRDREHQKGLLTEMLKTTMTEQLWEEEQLKECRLGNWACAQVEGLNPEGTDGYDVVDDEWLTLRQRLTIFARRMESAQAQPRYPRYVKLLKGLREYELAQKRLMSSDDDVDMADIYPANPSEAKPRPPFTPGQENCVIPPFPIWGPNAPWTDYQSLSSTPTDKTINEYAAELSRCPVDPSPWPLPPDGKIRDYIVWAPPGHYATPFEYSKLDGNRRSVACPTDYTDYGSESGWDDDSEDDEPAPSPRKRGIDEVEQSQEEEGNDEAREGDGAPSRKRVRV